MSPFPHIAYVGMTHLGVCSAVAAASKGFATLGFDPDSALVAQLTAGELPVLEPDLDDLLAARRARIAFSADPSALAECDLIYVAPDVPTDESGRSDLSSINLLLELVLDNSSSKATIVVLSQVQPGYTRAHQRKGRTVVYQAETLVFGRAVERATKPERLIVGCADPATPLPGSMRRFLEAFDCPILPMRFESAELTKLSINCYLAASVSVANTLAELSERIGADWSEIAPALRLDRRIGPHSYVSPGLGLAGGNLERDLAGLIGLSEEFGTESTALRAFVTNSAHRKNWTLRALHEALLAHHAEPTIGVLGLAYKENTHSVKNSPSLALLRHLAPWPVRVFDPAVPASIVPHPRITAASSAKDAVAGVDALVIMTPWPEFRRLACTDLAAAMRGKLVLDPFGLLDRGAARTAGLDHRVLGVF